MSHIFLSYANEDREQARRLVGLLETTQLPVWWDRRIPAGMNWNDVLDRALNEMQCMVVLWTRHSVASNWVYEEAEEGRKRGALLPVLLEAVQPPRGFRGIQCADLSTWNGRADDVAAQQFLNDLQSLLNVSNTASSINVTPSLPAAEEKSSPKPSRKVAIETGDLNLSKKTSLIAAAEDLGPKRFSFTSPWILTVAACLVLVAVAYQFLIDKPNEKTVATGHVDGQTLVIDTPPIGIQVTKTPNPDEASSANSGMPESGSKAIETTRLPGTNFGTPDIAGNTKINPAPDNQSVWKSLQLNAPEVAKPSANPTDTASVKGIPYDLANKKILASAARASRCKALLQRQSLGDSLSEAEQQFSRGCS